MMTPKIKRTRTRPFSELVAFCLIAFAAMAFLAFVPAPNRSQPGVLDSSSSSSQAVVIRRASLPITLGVKWARELYAYSPSVFVTDVDGDGRPEILNDTESPKPPRPVTVTLNPELPPDTTVCAAGEAESEKSATFRVTAAACVSPGLEAVMVSG